MVHLKDTVRELKTEVQHLSLPISFRARDDTTKTDLALETPLLALFVLTTFVSAKTVEYNLTIAEEKMNITGKPVMHVTNRMDVSTSVHWHGILVPPDMDGVPFVTYPPIKSGTTFTYRFPIRQTGTYWYHSHSGLPEQRGGYPKSMNEKAAR